MDAPLQDVFDWHARPGALVRLSPPWQPIEVIQEADSLRDGTAIFKIPGGLRWRAQHQPSEYRPPELFADRLEGPLSLVMSWRHRHEFTAEGAGRTRLTDHVDTLVPRFLLQPMFRYRHRKLAEDLAIHAELGSPPLTVAVTGPDGPVATAFTALLTTGGHRVVRTPTDERLDATVHVADDVTRIEAGGRTVSVRNGSRRGGPTWIALDDLCDVYLRAIADDSLSGRVNAVAPGNGVIEPVRLLARGHRFRHPNPPARSIVDRMSRRASGR
ncbi:SRPBCC family protein [Actinosynnema sp. ALI-1.44]|uniref:SRPBCC family protein n=1 Tax=Actinosynnema sp. ALI-1.44 TaxID=1933779 RepID=UPI00192D064E|nr:SRPBCC family protein [Actinosynnema sp. ALI-1.44]